MPFPFVLLLLFHYTYISLLHGIPLLFFAQAIQEVFVANEWVKDARNDAQVEANLHVEANKALGRFEQKNKKLTSKLVTEERVRLNAKADLKNV